MIVILWVSALLAGLAGAIELANGQALLGAVLLVMAVLVGPGGHALLGEDDSTVRKH